MILLMLIKLLIHFLTSGNYEIHRDGLLYISLGEHPAWGYVSVPPSIGFFAGIARFLFGDTPFGIRFFPAVIGALSILIIALTVKEIGGKTMAVAIACLAYLLSPAFLRSNALFQPVSFDEFYWLLSAFFIVRMINRQQPIYWLWLGVTWGLAFLNKYAIVFFVTGFFIALILSKHRRLLLSWYFPAGMVVGLMIALPNLIWQLQHNWPVIGHMRELRETQLVNVEIRGFLLSQLMFHANVFWVWLFGLIFLLFLPPARKFRIMGWLFVLVIGILLYLRGKPYYTLGLYSFLFVFGGYALEIYLAGKRRFINYGLIGLMVLLLVPILPISLPVLPLDKMLSYSQRLAHMGFTGPLIWEDGRIHDLPQDYADMTGWDDLAKIVAEKYHRLTPEEKATCILFAENYGEAGALNYYGDRYGLPQTFSFHESFVFWAPDRIQADKVIFIGDNEELNELFHHVELAGILKNPYARESGLPVYFCSQPKIDFQEFWQLRVREEREPYQ